MGDKRLASDERARVTTNKRNMEITKERESGKTIKELGKLYGVSHQRIDQIVKKMILARDK